eukprot:7691433-Pyramimonas_sp.AAC.1
MPAAAFGAVSPAASGAARNFKLKQLQFTDYRGWPKEAVVWPCSGNLTKRIDVASPASSPSCTSNAFPLRTLQISSTAYSTSATRSSARTS